MWNRYGRDKKESRSVKPGWREKKNIRAATVDWKKGEKYTGLEEREEESDNMKNRNGRQGGE